MADGTVKCIDEEIPFEIPESWEWCRMSAIMEVKGGKRIPLGKTFSETPTSHIYIRVTDMKNGTLVDWNLKYIDDDVFEAIKNYTISKDDLYLTIAGTIGSIGDVPEMFDGMNLTENAVKLTYIQINKRFLTHMVNSDCVQSQFRALTNQQAQPKLSIRSILSTLVPIPPLNEQQRISDSISRIEPLINKYGNVENELKKLNENIFALLKKSILQEAIQGKLVPQIASEGDASELLKQIEQEKQKLVKEGKLKKKDLVSSTIFRGDDNKYYENVNGKIECIDDEIPFEIPSTWNWIRLGVLFQHNTGKALNASNKTGELKPYITTSNLYWNRFELENLREMYFTQDEIERYSVKKGDLLVCEGGDVGRTAIWNNDYELCIQNHIHKLRPYISISVDFFYHVFYFLKTMGYIGGKGIGIQGLSSGALDKLYIPMPPLNEQIRIVNELSTLIAKLG